MPILEHISAKKSSLFFLSEPRKSLFYPTSGKIPLNSLKTPFRAALNCLKKYGKASYEDQFWSVMFCKSSAAVVTHPWQDFLPACYHLAKYVLTFSSQNQTTQADQQQRQDVHDQTCSLRLL